MRARSRCAAHDRIDSSGPVRVLGRARHAAPVGRQPCPRRRRRYIRRRFSQGKASLRRYDQAAAGIAAPVVVRGGLITDSAFNALLDRAIAERWLEADADACLSGKTLL